MELDETTEPSRRISALEQELDALWREVEGLRSRPDVDQFRRLEHAARRRREQFIRLQTITSDLAGALTSDRVAELIVDHGVAALLASEGALWIASPDGSEAQMLRHQGKGLLSSGRFSRVVRGGEGPIAEALRTGRSLFIESRETFEQRYPGASDGDPGLRYPEAFACVPLLVADKVIGAAAFSFADRRVLDDDETAFATLLAMHGAQALQRAQLYEMEQRARSEMALLYSLMDAVSRAETVEAVYAAALDAVCGALGVNRSAVLLYDESGLMRFKAWRGLSDAYRAAVDGHSPWTRDTKDPEPLLVSDTEADPSVAEYAPVFRAEGIRALGFIPLVYRQKLIGKFMIYEARPRVFTREELQLAGTIATQVAQALARKFAEAESQRAHAQAEMASRMKDEFLAVVSHELRTPLSAITGWATILREKGTTDPGTLAKGIEVIERNARAQGRIIEDILDVSRIITGKLVFSPRPTSLVSAIEEALDSVRASASAKEIAVTFVPSDDPHFVIGDPERLRQVVWNLLSNAIKFTPQKGRVEVRLGREGSAVFVEVEDTGRGIEPAFLPHVFERFSQADGSTTRSQGGLGLGLAIVRHLVELHGGHVRVRSDGHGKGAVFTVFFPVAAIVSHAAEAFDSRAAPQPGPEDAGEPVSLEGVRVLLVDDEEDARDLIGRVLREFGADVQAASSARGALAELRAFRPDVVVSDIGMPVEDGYALIRKIRRQPSPLRDVPAIALTAYARGVDEQRALDAGFQSYLSKPADPRTLARTIRRACRKAA